MCREITKTPDYAHVTLSMALLTVVWGAYVAFNCTDQKYRVPQDACSAKRLKKAASNVSRAVEQPEASLVAPSKHQVLGPVFRFASLLH
jgi:hypothetical protein